MVAVSSSLLLSVLLVITSSTTHHICGAFQSLLPPPTRPTAVTPATRFGSRWLRQSLPFSSSLQSRCNNPLLPLWSALNASNENNADSGVTTIVTNGIVDPSELLSSKDDGAQRLGFAAICLGVLSGGAGFVGLYDFLEAAVLPQSVFGPFYDVLPIVLGGAFLAAGVAHFAIEDTFVAFTPPLGTWGGLWRVPAPGAKTLFGGVSYARYHVYWTGVAEILSGAALVAGTILLASSPSLGTGGGGEIAAVLLPPGLDGVAASAAAGYTAGVVSPTVGVLPPGVVVDGVAVPSEQAAAAIVSIPLSVLPLLLSFVSASMLLLTAAVTPANAYMYTHDPAVPRIPALSRPWGHLARGVLQSALLAVFFKLTVHYYSLS